MSSNVEVEPGAATESGLVTTDSFENFEQMSSSLEEIKSTNAISHSEESNDNTHNDNFDESTNPVENSEDDDYFEHNKEWANKSKHVFVLSLAGKPIYSR